MNKLLRKTLPTMLAFLTVVVLQLVLYMFGVRSMTWTFVLSMVPALIVLFLVKGWVRHKPDQDPAK